MALDPNISLGVRQMELANPLAQYGQIAAIQNAQNQNQLAQFQLGSARRQEESQNALSDAYQKSFNPQTGQFDPKLLISNVAQSKAAYLLPDIQSKLLESESKQATMAKTTQETEAGKFKLQQDKLNYGLKSLGDSPTPQDAIKKLNEGVTKGYFDFSTAAAETQKLQSMTPEQYKQYRIEKVLGLVDAKDKLGFMLPKNVRQEAGGKILTIQDNPMLPGYSQPIAGMDITKTATIGEITGQGQLGLAREKFAFEQANPGMTIQEDANGLLAVNNRTGVAIPVVYGQAGFQPALAAAPAAGPSIMRQQGAGMPGQRTPAIPGMTSVLDQTAMPLVAQGGERMPGMPVAGKEKALTETQSNATAYGMRMKEANAILEDLAKKGVLKGAVIEGTPLIGGALGQALPSVLGGSSAAQQQVNQAKSNFITAVLRKESGAVISDSEFDREDKKYFPQINDNASVIKQKENARKLAIKAIEVQAGPGAKEIQKYQPSVGGGVDTSNPLLR